MFFNHCWIAGSIPEDWKEALVITIFKKDVKYICNNYRGHSLLNSCYKICVQILENIIKNIVDIFLLESQYGFRKGKSCSHCVSTIMSYLKKMTDNVKK